MDVQKGGTFVKKMRVQAHYTQQTLHEISGITTAQISRIEKGYIEKPDSEKVATIGKVLGFSVQDYMIACGVVNGTNLIPGFKALEAFIATLPEQEQEELLKLLYETTKQYRANKK